jgi:acyl-CoA dehydrogenase
VLETAATDQEQDNGFEYSATQQEICSAVGRICAGFDLDYWRACDESGDYPTDFVKAMTEAGWLAALIPEAYGGWGLSLMHGCVILKEINRSAMA